MAESTLQDRLREHSKAFDGLLSLIPAKMYYGEDNSEQWKRTKQTKAEAKAAKTAKLDPDSELNRNAKEVMDERAARNKRKLEAMQEEEDKEDDEPIPGVQRELPGQGLRMNKDYNKKQKTADLPIDTIDDANPAEMSQNQLMRMAKKEAKLEKRATKKAKKAEKKAAKLEAAGGDAAAVDAEVPEVKESSKPADTKVAKSPAAAKKESNKKQQKKAESKDAKPVSNDHDRDAEKDEDEEYETVDESDDEAEPSTKSKSKSADLNPLDLSGLAQQQKATESSGASTPASPTFDTAAAATASTTTSTSSTVPPSEKPKHIKLPADTSALRARLAARIEALRAARKADGPDGKPIRTRQELIEARRFKQAQRKEHKKELRTKAKLEEEARREETLASNSPSVMSPRVGLGGDDGDEPANFAFGRVAFDDGTKLSHDLSHALNTHKKRGPSDPKTALIKIQNQKKRLAALDKEKQADIAEKEQWLIARKRAEGERVRDDEQALKRAVKRKEQTKKKSEKAWKERSDGVAKSIREKQKKREDNLKKRKDDKLVHKLGRKSGKKVGGGGAKKTKARPGFEGSFGGGKKKK
ncbi:surfeit locus protein 6 [Colletotrichum scovillei]|uniref:Surfeit locus protein 6 n=1 Tax=Colletotrichum scovillei TaxID=1209932 RepID=A0A9P7U7P2_9PEZI|nr:surfeit locus protein 6 [Colletotrichum scovillei]KAF4774563.1 surfeit locus protein 6 [Colletotrichum scovillei]KAG7042800.1 surfeit locus protein 6 [Colletotrichum scovillei]KAG7043393.1 surfeit locus protein 6 [Colletotrichum scovillei]KAG7062842.1 surfeit locus protein 6 [Colletotrichum scovillei]